MKVSGSTLKLIAMGSMLIDHIGAIFFYSEDFIVIYRICRNLGRLAFPIFCFLLVEGFVHTRNLKKYCIRLFLFGIIAEIPFDIAFNQKIYEPQYQNVFFTLAIGIMVLAGIKKWKNNLVLVWGATLFGCFASILMSSDYSYKGIIMIVLFYWFYESQLLKYTFVALLNLSFQPFAILALIPIHLYNGGRGMKLKYIFYWFYPIHLLVFSFIYQCLAHQGIKSIFNY